MSFSFEASYYPIREILNWNEQKVGNWLQQIGFGKYSRNFAENMINGEALLELNYTYLKDLNIISVGDRVKLSTAISKLRDFSIKKDQEVLAGTDFTDSLSAKLHDLKLWKFAWEKETSLSKDALFSDFSLHQNISTSYEKAQPRKPTPAKSFSSLKKDLKINTPARTTSRFHNSFIRNLDHSTFDSKNYLSSPELCLESPGIPDSYSNPGPASDRTLAYPERSPVRAKLDNIMVDRSKSSVPSPQTAARDFGQINTPASYITSLNSITVKGPNNESKAIPIHTCKSGKEILHCVLKAFELSTDMDADKYSIFIVSVEGEGARILDNYELFNLCSDQHAVENTKFFLKKRHQIAVSPPSAERDAELQRTIEMLGNFVPGGQNSIKGYKQHQHQHQHQHQQQSASLFNTKKTPKNRLNLHVLPHKKSINQLYKVTQANNKTPNTVLSQHFSPNIDPHNNPDENISSFFGNRPPSDEVHRNLGVFFPGNEENARNSIIRGHMKKVLNYSADLKTKPSPTDIPPEPAKIPSLRTQHSAENFDRFAKSRHFSGNRLRTTKQHVGNCLLANKSSFPDKDHYLSNPIIRNHSPLITVQKLTNDSLLKAQSKTPNSENSDMPIAATNTSDPRNSPITVVGKFPKKFSPELQLSSNNKQPVDPRTTALQDGMGTYQSPAPASNRLSSLNEIKKELMQSANMSWIKGAPISSGSFGSVFYGIHTRTGIIMAVKQVDIPTPDLESKSRKHKMFNALKLEIELLKSLQHKNIVRYLGYESDAKSLYIFLEYVPGGSVKSALLSFGVFPESLVKFYIRQILEGLVYLHDSNIIHCDIKGGNVLIDHAGNVKISDFGISKKVEEVGLNSKNRASLQGSVYWMAPEIVKDSNYTLKCDIWSLGCLVIEMLTGKHPFPESDQFQALLMIGKKTKPETPGNISTEASDFIEKTLAINLDKRPSAKELLEHPFVASGPRN